MLERRGWEVWRGGFLHANRKDDVYPNVRRRYSLVEDLLGDAIAVLQYVGVVHHGMPDPLCHANNSFRFVECKLGYEPLRDRQKRCVAMLQGVGYDVEIHRVVSHRTQRRLVQRNVFTGETKTLEKQRRLTRHASH